MSFRIALAILIVFLFDSVVAGISDANVPNGEDEDAPQSISVIAKT